MKKTFIILAIVCIAAAAASAMPSQYDDDYDGWFGAYIFYSQPLGHGSPSFGLDVRGAEEGDIGIDFQIMMGGLTGISLGAAYFLNPSGPSIYTSATTWRARA